MSDRPTDALTPREEALFDPLTPGFSADPHPVFRRMREHDPVHRTSRGFWLVARYDDALTVMRDRRFGRGRSAETIRRGPERPVQFDLHGGPALPFARACPVRPATGPARILWIVRGRRSFPTIAEDVED